MIRAALPTSLAASGANAPAGPGRPPALQRIFAPPPPSAGSTAPIFERFCTFRFAVSFLFGDHQ